MTSLLIIYLSRDETMVHIMVYITVFEITPLLSPCGVGINYFFLYNRSLKNAHIFNTYSSTTQYPSCKYSLPIDTNTNGYHVVKNQF